MKKISELDTKSFLGAAGAAENSYVLINYEDSSTSEPVTYKATVQELGKAIASNLHLYMAPGNTTAPTTISAGNGTYTNNTSLNVATQSDIQAAVSGLASSGDISDIYDAIPSGPILSIQDVQGEIDSALENYSPEMEITGLHELNDTIAEAVDALNGSIVFSVTDTNQNTKYYTATDSTATEVSFAGPYAIYDTNSGENLIAHNIFAVITPSEVTGNPYDEMKYYYMNDYGPIEVTLNDMIDNRALYSDFYALNNAVDNEDYYKGVITSVTDAGFAPNGLYVMHASDENMLTLIDINENLKASKIVEDNNDEYHPIFVGPQGKLYYFNSSTSEWTEIQNT